LIHVATTDTSADGDDWIVEGIAEYYSLLLLLRSGGISGTRFQGTLEDLRDWMVKDRGKLSDPSTGADTARAVLLFRDLDVELAAAGARLDDVITKLLAGRMDRKRLQTLTEAELGRPSKVLADADMPAID
jgi:predicted metalloprotease with PDZ domain